jgi:adenosylcobinamide-phosphate synthase
LASYLADLIFGDPERLPHPVRGMGKMIGFLDNRLARSRISGVILAFVVIGVSACLAYLLVKLSPILGIYLGYTTLSVKDLQVKARAVMKEDSIAEARKYLAMIVGRDTQNLDKERIVTATIESIAESTNDGIVAPLFYLTLGGPVAAISYKAINTLDSMVGYKNERYLHFGWFSAKLDDIANFIPARISGFLISISSGKRFIQSLKTMAKDSRKHASPNSGVSEAAMAGALGIRLGGEWSYQGKIIKRHYIGEEKRQVQPSLINEALTISLIVSILMVSLGVLFRWLI